MHHKTSFSSWMMLKAMEDEMLPNAANNGSMFQ